MCRVTENRTTETSDLDVLYTRRKAQGSREDGRRFPAEKKKRDYGWMGQMKADGSVSVPVAVLEAARRDFCAERVGDEEVSRVIDDVMIKLTDFYRLWLR